MTDQTVPSTTGQTSTPSPQPTKKTFFGGEIAFDDPTAFEAVDIPQTSGPSSSSSQEIQEDSEEQEIQQSEPIADSHTFDPFGEEEQDTDGTKGEMNEQHDEQRDEQQDHQQVDQEVELSGVEEQKALETLNDTTSQGPIIEKFLSLVHTARTILSLQEDKQSFTILGGKTTTSTLEYHVYLVEDEEHYTDLFIKKVDTNNQTQEENEHLLQWSYHTQLQTLDVFVDEFLLYQGMKNVDERTILDKLDKFGFLFDTCYADLNKAYLEKKETENKKKQLHEIFRNF